MRSAAYRCRSPAERYPRPCQSPARGGRSAPKRPFDRAAMPLDMHRTAVRAVGFELGAIELFEQRGHLRLAQHAAHAHRAMTGKLLQQILERARVIGPTRR